MSECEHGGVGFKPDSIDDWCPQCVDTLTGALHIPDRLVCSKCSGTMHRLEGGLVVRPDETAYRCQDCRSSLLRKNPLLGETS